VDWKSGYPLFPLSVFFFFCGDGIWTQGLHLKPLHQPFFVKGFFEIGSWTICPGWLWTVILLISAPWVAKITGMSHWRPAPLSSLWIKIATLLLQVKLTSAIYPEDLLSIFLMQKEVRAQSFYSWYRVKKAIDTIFISLSLKRGW
jgi:hypothetical protein